MWLRKVRIQNVKSFADSGEIEFSKHINLLVGNNNAGKSTILRCLCVQAIENDAGSFGQRNMRLGTEGYSINVEISDPNPAQLPIEKQHYQNSHGWAPSITFTGDKNRSVVKIKDPSGREQNYNTTTIKTSEPNNLIYPFFSRRKGADFQEQVTFQHANAVLPTFQHLYSKIDRISNPGYPAHKEYAEACENIFGFFISCSLSQRGKQGGLVVNETEHVALNEMGEGVINLLGLIVDLCVAKQKVFLIEELENDIHPKALKKLLELILKKSESNQFIISTHSNIVTKYLGTQCDTKLYSVSMELRERLPTSKIELVENTATGRIKVLSDLGYDLFDFDLWKGYLLLEESTAERVIRSFLIPTFCPKLENRLRTIAAGGIADVEPRFADFLRLFVFVHTAEPYKNKAWVFVDGDDEGRATVSRLQQKFKGWSPKHFQTFKQASFEEYYPKRFSEKVSAVLAMPNGQERQSCKGKLVEELMQWATEKPAEAKKEFAQSAKEVIDLLKEIDAQL